jgi:outer membrane protein assembly factor BamB
MNGRLAIGATRRAALFASLILTASAARAGDWSQFRGPFGAGLETPANLPTSFDKKGTNIAWKAPLPGKGLSSPVVAGGRVFVTASSMPRQDRLHVLCFDEATGKKLWERQLWATGATNCHPKTNMAAPTPATDGKRLVALYSTNDVACFDLDGSLLWYRGLGKDYVNASNSVGMSSSPLIVGDVAVLQIESQGDAFVVGLDMTTGKNRWKLPRPHAPNWSSPIVLPDSTPTVLILGDDGLTAIDPSTGKERWKFAARCHVIPSASVGKNVLCIPSNGLTVLRYQPDRPATEVAWKSNRLRPSTPSPLVYGDRVYILESGILKCAELAKGDVVWQLRLKGPFSASPVAADGKIYCFSEDGVGYAVQTGREGKIVGQGNLNETILCTPAIADGALFVRSDGHLWKIAKTDGVARAN